MGLRTSSNACDKPGAILVLVVSSCVVACGPSVGDADGGGRGSSSSSGGESTGGTFVTTVDVDGSSGGSTSAATITTSSTTESSSTAAADSTTGFVSHCEVPPDTPPLCWERICDIFVCGDAPSLYDDEGCPRPVCEGQADCIEPSVCGANILASPCVGGQYGWYSCEEMEGQCVCGGSLGCGPDSRGYCRDPDEILQSDLCLASAWPCDMLDYLVADTHTSLVEIAPEMSDELLEQARECQWQRMQRVFDECGLPPCDMLCEHLPAYTGCEPTDCSFCAAADPLEVLELLQALVDRSLACADCALCDELQSELCTAIMGC